MKDALLRPDVAIPALDGFQLAASVLTPRRSHAIAVVAGATGVKRSFYAPFAKVLAQRGFEVVTFDYRGVGGSAPKQLRGFHAKMEEWGRLDLEGALLWADAQRAGRRLVVVGHSVGGQMVGFAPSAKRVDAAFFVGAQSGWVGHWPPAQRLVIGALWYGLIPSLSPLLGFFPSGAFGLGEDLPAGVARQWAEWGRDPNYLLAAGSDVRGLFAAPTFPLVGASIAGDLYAPPAAVAALLGFYQGAKRRHWRIVDADAPGVGHFTFFRDAGKPLWATVADWLLDPTVPLGDPAP